MNTKKEINIQLLEKKLFENGMNKSALAGKINVSREAVSKWFKKETQPSASKLFKISKLLSLSFDDIYKIEYVNEPIIQYRKRANSKITGENKDNAKELCSNLEKLLPYVTYESYEKPPILINPNNNYDYIKSIVDSIKKDNDLEKVKYKNKDIIKLFEKYHAILIPVLWGTKEKKYNGIRIYIPESMTNWVYLNLDTNPLDFRFWMLHEIGHVLTQDMGITESEKFADTFAGEFLFPEKYVIKLYKELLQETSDNNKYSKIISKAEELTICPLTIYYQIINYCERNEKKEIEFSQEFFKRVNGFKKGFKTISESVFKENQPEAKKYIDFVNEEIQSPFFRILKKYIESEDANDKFIKNVLDISHSDAKNIYNSL